MTCSARAITHMDPVHCQYDYGGQQTKIAPTQLQ